MQSISEYSAQFFYIKFEIKVLNIKKNRCIMMNELPPQKKLDFFGGAAHSSALKKRTVDSQ